MSRRRYRTAIIGFGKIGAEYADDVVMARHYPVATHAQALADHPAFEWRAVDLRPGATTARRNGRAIEPASVAQLAREEPQLAVLRRCPVASDIISLPGTGSDRGKPLGRTLMKRAFVRRDRARYPVQVNYWRRADDDFRVLPVADWRAVGRSRLYSASMAATHNGSHMFDFCRMLFGEVIAVEAESSAVRHRSAPIAGDIDVPFHLVFESGLCAMFQPVDFADYRENSLDIWGSRGRLQIVQEGLRLLRAARVSNRAMQGEWEIPSDAPEVHSTTVGYALRRFYDHTASMLDTGEAAISPADSALHTEEVIEAVVDSATNGGARRYLATGVH